MPNRILKESIRTSKSVNAMSDFQFRLWAYLITYVDDYGRGSADAELLKGFVFPRRKGVTESAIEKALADLANMGLVNLYEVDGEPYLYFPNWGKHQRIQTKRSKFPEPPMNNSTQPNDTENNSVSPLVTVGHRGSPPESESKYKSESKEESEEYICTERKPALVPAVFALPLNDGSEYEITEKQVQEWAELYPAVDIMQDLRKMKGWLNSNPAKKKTRRGILRFITNWFSRTQDKGGNQPQDSRQQQSSGNIFAKLALEEMEGGGFDIT